MCDELPRPTNAELEILTVLWSIGPSTVRAVYDVIRRRPAQYSTVLRFMQIMAKKGLVRRDEKERAHIYEASKPREWTQRQLAGDLLERAFSGSAKALLIGAPDNKFKQEHYRRIAFANQRFTTAPGTPGWQTDRGHIYIVYGPPDEIDSHLKSAKYPVAIEVWTYRHVDGVGNNDSITFVDHTGRGDYHLAPSSAR
ncbi:MAG: GWxTD domain-containing protein [Candidatus Acidiferrales bacterium]